MLSLTEQKHLAYYDDCRSYFASFTMQLQRLSESGDKDKSDVGVKDKPRADRFSFEIRIKHEFTFEWQSKLFQLSLANRTANFGKCPFSLQNYFQIYQDPQLQRFQITPKAVQSEEEIELLYGQVIGKLIIHTRFSSNAFRLPVNIQDSPTFTAQTQKLVSVIAANLPKETILCSGTLVDTRYFGEVANFVSDHKYEREGFVMKVFAVEQRVEAQHVVVVRGNFNSREFRFDKAIVRIFSQGQDIFFMPGLMQHLQQIKTTMGELDSLTIIQNFDTRLEDGHRFVFYSDSSSLYSRVYRSYLYDKIRDKWLIEGMVGYNRSNKHFQDVIRELMDLMTEGEELVALQDDTFHFDRVWRLKAVFLYHVLSNFKTMRDYGSSSLANLIIEQSRRTKITSQVLFKRLKNKYGLKNFRTIYEQQFVKSTGINRIFYEIIDLKRENRVKIIVRQKALANKVFRLYNMFRIKLEQEYGCLSPLMEKIINKNKFLERKKELSGPLAVPKFLKCLPYFRGHVAVQTDASQMPFELELREENIIEEKQNVTSKIRAPLRKTGEAQKSYEGFEWIMIDTAYIFPAIYKNENVHEGVILEKIKRRYDSEHEEIKVLNCISSRDHSSSQKICRALIEKVRINANAKENCSINVKRKVLQILPVFLSKATDFGLWEDMLDFLKLYEPICHDYSEEGYHFLLSLLESLGEIEHKKQFGYYFQQFHRIMLVILRELNGRSEDREERLKMTIFNSLMKWASRYSIEILEEVTAELRLGRFRVRQHLQILKVIFSNIFGYLRQLHLTASKELVRTLLELVEEIISRDSTFSLFAIKFSFDIAEKERELGQPLAFLKHVFGLVQTYKEENIRKFGVALQALKEQLNRNKKVYGLEMQLTLSENQNYFIAEYLWGQLVSALSSRDHFIRLQWIKIYRVFYFYFIPVVTLRKMRNNLTSHEYRVLSEDATQDILSNLKAFFPDIRWFSGYDSRSAKELKAKYEQMNENKRKKKFEEYSFSENNVITMFIRQHPGRESWDQLAREAIRIFISIYEDKEQRSEGKEAERFKSIQEGFKKIETKLKRGRMPDFYNYQQLKEEIGHLMQEYREEEKKVSDILLMVDKVLSDISQEKGRREAQLRDEMRIIINLDSIHEEEEDEQAPEELQAEAEDQLLFGEDQQEREVKDDEALPEETNKVEADQDEMIFGAE